MAQELLVDQHIEAGQRFISEIQTSLPVSVAFWVLPATSEEWRLYVAIDGLAGTGLRAAVGEVHRLLFDKRTQWLDPLRVYLIDSTEPMARAAIAARDRFPGHEPVRYHGSWMGMEISGAVIYPRQQPALVCVS